MGYIDSVTRINSDRLRFEEILEEKKKVILRTEDKTKYLSDKMNTRVTYPTI